MVKSAQKCPSKKCRTRIENIDFPASIFQEYFANSFCKKERTLQLPFHEIVV